MRKEIYFGLSVKIIVVISSIIIFTSIILNWFFITGQTRILKKFIENRIAILAKSVATSSEYAVSSPEPSMEFLYHLGKNCLKEENVIYSAIYDAKGLPLTIQINANANENVQKYVDSTPIETGIIQNLKDTGLKKDISNILTVGEILDVVVPIISTDYSPNIQKSERYKIIGVVRIGADLSDINYKIKKMIKSSILITIMILFVGILVSFFIAGIIVKSTEKEIGIKK